MTRTIKDRLIGLACVLAAAGVLGALSALGRSAGQAGFMLGGAAVGALLLAAALLANQPPE